MDERNQKGETPLVLSFKNGHVDAAKLLLNEARLNVWFFPIAHNKPESLTAAVSSAISSKEDTSPCKKALNASTHCWFRAGSLHPQTAAHFIDLGGKCQHMCAWGSASFTHRLLSRRACTRQLDSRHVGSVQPANNHYTKIIPASVTASFTSHSCRVGSKQPGG
jgi:hypothetical protein